MIGETSKKMVAICMGQSNSANHGDIKMSAPDAVKVLKDLELVQASDPLAGATGQGGSVWTRLGTQLINSNAYDEVVFIPIAINGSSVAEWSPNLKYFKRFLDACSRTHQVGLEVTHVFWHQGERDTALKNGYEYYYKHLNDIVSRISVELPLVKIMLCIASYRFGVINEDVRSAQKAVILNNDLILGPDTDKIGGQYRHDNLHFNAEGQRKVAKLIFECIV